MRPLWFVLALVALALAGGLVAAHAHSFYPWECCHDRDCWAMGLDADAKEPEPRFAGGHWVLSDGTLVADTETRPSPDGRFHVCRRAGAPDGAVIGPPGRPLCLWTPRPGS